MAEKLAMFDYVGVSKATMCWAAWKEGDGDSAERFATEAFGAWAKLPAAYVYPLQWLVRMPLAAYFVALDRIDDAYDQWQALLDPRQHLLPDPLRHAIEGALAHRAGGPSPVEANPGVPSVIRLAQELRYL
jgi:hypothetical protein